MVGANKDADVGPFECPTQLTVTKDHDGFGSTTFQRKEARCPPPDLNHRRHSRFLRCKPFEAIKMTMIGKQPGDRGLIEAPLGT